jgi:tetratricopeptide (TPR) repeat protein
MKSAFYVAFIFSLLSTSLFPQNLQKARRFFDESKFQQAKTELEKIVDNNSKNHEAYFYLGKTYFALNIFDDASDAFEEAVDLNDKNADYHYWLGKAYGQDAVHSSIFTQTMLAPKIKNEFLRAVELDKNHVQARIGLIRFYRQAPGIMGGSNEKAYQNANILVKIDEKKGRTELAALYIADNKLKEAENEFKILEKKFEVDPEFYFLYNSYGYALLGAGRIDEAIVKFKKQVELAPDKANPYDSLGDAYLAAGKKNEAREQFKKAISIDPEFEASFNKLKQIDSGK